MVPVAVGMTSIVLVALSPLPIIPRLQVTVPPLSPQLPAVVVADTKVTLPGRVSLNDTVVVDGPWLVTTRV